MHSLPVTSTVAAILVAQRQPLVVDEIGLPATLDVGQVLVAYSWSGICGSQLGEIDGVKGPDPWLPHLLGHEASGRVVATGPGVRHVAAGDTVVAHWRPGRGIEAAPARYAWRGRDLFAGRVTTFSRHAVVSENRLTPVPAGVDPRVAALCGCALTTGFGVVEGRARVRLGDAVVVCGTGGVGLAVVRGAGLAGARAVVAVDRFANRLALASRLGATHAVDAAGAVDWAAAAAAHLGGPADVVIDTTGDPEAIARGFDLAGPQGRLVLVGVPRAGAAVTIATLPLHHGRSIVGTEGGDGDPPEAIPRYLALAAARGIDLAEMVSDTGPLEAVNDLIDRMRTGRAAGRCLLDLRG